MQAGSLFKKFLIQKSGTIFIVLFVLSALGFFVGSRVQLKLSLTDLLPDKHPAVEKFNKITEIVGGVGYLAIVLDAQDKKSHLDIAPKLVEELSKSPLVKGVFFRREQRYFVDRLMYYVETKDLLELEKNIRSQIRTARSSVLDLGLFEEEKEKKKEEKYKYVTGRYIDFNTFKSQY